MSDAAAGNAPDDPAGLLGLLRLLREEGGLDLATLAPARGGESGAAFWATGRDGVVGLLKVMPDPGLTAVAYLGELGVLVGRLRERGYPAPPFRAMGRAAGLAFWMQQKMPGATVDSAAGPPDRGLIGRLMPELIRLNDLQAGLGHLGRSGQPGWPDLITTTLTEGGAGYCVHATLAARPDTRGLLGGLRRIGETCCPAVPDAGDFVHYDLSPANLLTDGTTITGVIDVNPPVLAGDRAFDLATALFYLYGHDQARRWLWPRLLDLAGPRAARAYLAHLVLRQVDWSLRFHPAATATGNYLHLARRVMADISNDQAPAG